MPPVRWKRLYLVAAITIVVPLLKTADAQHMHDAISMSEDGWRPIIGTKRLPPNFESELRLSQYHNPSNDADVEIVRSESPVHISSTNPPIQHKPREPIKESANLINSGTTIYHFNQGNKKSPDVKHPSSSGYHTIQAGTHRPQVPLGGVTVGRPSQFGIKKPLIKVTSPPGLQGGKRKPARTPIGAHSNRQEVYIPATGADGFTLRKPGPSNIKTRETQGLGLFGSNPYTLNQQHGQFEFSNRFTPGSGGHLFEQFKSNPVTYIYSKGPFKSQSDEYTRNLVPPPLHRIPNQDKDKENLKTKHSSKFNDNVVVPSIQEPVSFGIKQIAQFGLRPHQLQENLVSQLHFEPNYSFQKQIKPKEPAVDVQVTKEKFKVFHNEVAPNLSNKPPPQYVDYTFHGLSSVQPNLPKLQTYEVTEGKWIDNPNPFTYSFQPTNGLTVQSARPLLSTARPQLVSEPIVELNLPPFLPTPFKPEGTAASPSQPEVSTIFNQVSAKMNKHKHEQLSNNPLFFNVKEVSTHYPVIGRPEFTSEAQSTDTPLPMNENGEISNDITTTQKPKPKPRRRRPQPRRPTTTTTTEEPSTENLSYELQKMQESYEMSFETEAPPKKIRQRPNRYRTNPSSDNYRTTTSATDIDETSVENRSRGRHRNRQRGNNDVRYQNQRKRVRPQNTERPFNHKMTETDAPYMSYETSEITEEVPSIYETKVLKSSRSEENTVKSKLNRIEYQEAPKRKHVRTQEAHNAEDDTMVVTDEFPGLKLTIEEVTLAPVVTTITQETTMVSVNSPENEVDYTTPAIIEQNIKEYEEHEPIQTTIPTTTLPTTSTTEVQTTKPSRTRGRPNKYNSGNRPRFSVKDYRQRLNQYTSTTPSSTTDFVRTSEGSRLRFPNRLRTRGTTTTTTTTQQSQTADEEETTELSIRRRFRPKDPRHGSATTENSDIISDSRIQSVNTRLRPFGRYKSSTESSITGSKIAIKQNLYDAAKRRSPLTIRNKLNKDKTVEETTLRTEEEISDAIIPMDEAHEERVDVESNTEAQSNRASEKTSEVSEATTANLSDDDYSQRISDLTSSLKNEYETPGLFKTFSPNTRRIPSYFAISTEDPILPIEAFFPNIKEKDKEK